jgi:dTDP-4-amino-4,6-dideoxygalactose transaminase
VRITRDREVVRNRLSAVGIETRVFYPVPIHLQPCFSALGYRPGALPVAERLAGEALSLPLFAAVSQREIDEVSERLAEVLTA